VQGVSLRVGPFAPSVAAVREGVWPVPRERDGPLAVAGGQFDTTGQADALEGTAVAEDAGRRKGGRDEFATVPRILRLSGEVL
jgi:hypothetical protein